MRWARFLGVGLLVAACSGTSTPATTPIFVPTTTTSTTTTLTPTTTLDRVAEIEAIYQSLEERRLDALYRGDEPAYRAVHVDNGYLERSMELFDTIEFDAEPVPRVEVLELVHDGPECIALERVVHLPGVENEARTAVLELSDEVWLISFVGSGWTCEGPHPFDS